MNGNIIQSLLGLLSGVSGFVIQSLNMISAIAPEIAKNEIEVTKALIQGIVEALPYLVEAAVNLAIEFGKALIETDWGAIGNDILNSLGSALDLMAGEIFGADSQLLMEF